MSGAFGLGAASLWLAEKLGAAPLLYLADDEQEAEAVAAALAALAPEADVIFIPSSDTLPGDRAPASPANVGRRVSALRELRRRSNEQKGRPLAGIASGEGAARLYAEPAAFDAALPRLKKNDLIDVARFSSELEALGYIVDDRVDEPGEVAFRGEVVDIFPADAGLPVRIDLSDGRIVGIRRYDPSTQLSEEDCENIEIGRALEPTSASSVTLLAHFAPGRIAFSPRADERRQRFVRLASEVADKNRRSIDAVSSERWAEELKTWSVETISPAQFSSVPRFAEFGSPQSALKRFAAPLLKDGKRFLVAGSERDLRFLRPKLARMFARDVEVLNTVTDLRGLPVGSVATLRAPIDRGAISEDLVLIAAADLLGSRARIGAEIKTSSIDALQGSSDIRIGDLVIHEQHGIGRVLALQPAPANGLSELIVLEYGNGDRRLVPVHEAGRLWRYGADAEAVKLDRLDGASWEKRRSAIDVALAESVGELLALARARYTLEAPRIDPDPASYERFVAGFAFNETADQARTIETVRDDLASGRPMDRLVIGDVGYGKTEVALRAAALAALAGYQVALAAPTTVLVRQHLETFERRFALIGLRVASLSRLSTPAERKAVKTALADGTVSVVIGTGALMAKDVRFARLGLVVIDEEQRFGTAQKAKLRARPDLHVLAMSATPIPRTLHRALIGLQQISVIATPPARRQPIRTSLSTPDDTTIRTALLREHSRGGQSFVVAPRIEDLAPLSRRLRQIVPDLKLVEAHGKMPAAEIDEAMVRFADGDGDVLLATNIIEAGLDVPRANTMIVWRADRFGLAQLHQLRGRVGRGSRRGQIILTVEGDEIGAKTMKRLRTLSTYDRLGSGFEISAADLDQRGAGDPLSETQAGHMKLIGVDLYQHLFEAALRQARGGKAGLWQPDLRIGDAGSLPMQWIPDADIRLGLYVRLARIAGERDLTFFEEELTDRFGPLPEEAEQLLGFARIRILARANGIQRIDAGPTGIALTPYERDQPMPDGFDLVRQERRWLLREEISEAERADRVLELLENLAGAKE